MQMSILRRCSKGQIMVLYAGIIVGLLGATALCTDVAIMYLNSIQLQKGADSAAIAGASYLTAFAFTGAAAGCTGQPDDAKKAACTYASNNGIAVDGNLTIAEPTSALCTAGTCVKVTAQRTGLPYYFGKVVGLSTYDVGVTATAQASLPVGTVNNGLFPIGLQCAPPCTASSLVGGEPVSFGAKFVGGLSAGNWQWLDVSGTGANGVGDAITGGETGSYSFNGSISTKPGNNANAGPVKTAFKARMDKCDSYGTDPCSGSNPKDLIKAGDPCLVVVPVVNFATCGAGKCSMTIEGFAQIYIEPGNSSPSSINGCFVQSVAPETIGSSGAPNFGPVMPPTLIQ
jgi:Flp pilus assembly protein TadG